MIKRGKDVKKGRQKKLNFINSYSGYENKKGILMRVTFKFGTISRGILGEKEEEIDLPGTVTVEEALRRISDKYGHLFSSDIYDEKGNAGLSFHIDVLVNGRSITTLQGFKTKLKEGDKVAFLPIVSGG